MLKRIAAQLLINLLLLIPQVAFAKDKNDPDEKQPITIQSNSAEFDNKNGTAIYHGKVIMTQGSRTVLAEKLVITRDEEGKIKSLIANGSPAIVYATPDPQKPKTIGKGKTIQYFPKENKFILITDAELNQNNNIIQGPKLIYDLTTKILVSVPMPNGRTFVTLQPKPNSNP